MSHDDYPSRNFITSFERRFQEIERRIENSHRVGTVPKDGVKYDKEKKRWYVKLQQGEASEGKEPFTTDWLPWEAMASGWLKVSSPPREGQSIQMHAPCGTPESGSCRPYHNNPDTPSPSDKPDEFHMTVEMPDKDGKPGSDKNKILKFHFTQDGSKVEIGDTTHELSKDTISHTTKNDVTKASESHSIETKNRTVKADSTDIKSTSYALGGKVKINC